MGWREWLIDNTPEDPNTYHDVMEASGSSHKSEDKKEFKIKKLPPRCLYCKKFMGRNEGMHVFVNWDWKLHIKCFAKLEDELEAESYNDEL